MDVRIATRHRFASKDEAARYLALKHLRAEMGWRIIKHPDGFGVGWENEAGASVTDRLRPIYETWSDNRNGFIAAAIEAGFKKGTATTMWYNFKKEV